MQLFLFEARKIYVNARGWLILAVFALLLPLLWHIIDTPADEAAYYYHSQYQVYLQDVAGPLTASKEKQIEEEAQRINQAKIEYNHLLDAYYNGSLAEKEFQTQRDTLLGILSNEQGFNAVHDQYRYVYEHPENRYFLPVNGWSAVLGSTFLDYLLMFALIMIGVPIFCREHTSKMDAIIMSTRNGGRALGSYKPVILFATAVGCSLLLSASKLLFAQLKYGLAGGGYPLQSLPPFAHSVKDISIWQVFVALTVLKIFGAMYLAAMTLLVSALVHNQVTTFFLSAIFGLSPTLILTAAQQYALPLPSSFIMGQGFFLGQQNSTKYCKRRYNVLVFRNKLDTAIAACRSGGRYNGSLHRDTLCKIPQQVGRIKGGKNAPK